MAQRFETGTLPPGLPYLRLAGGPQVLVFFPGIGDALRPAAREVAFGRQMFAAFQDTCTVYLVSRRVALPEGVSIADMAQDYAAAVADIRDRERPADGRVDIMGMSFGGLIAYAFAAEHPDMIRRMVIAMAAHTAGPALTAAAGRWQALARQGRWLMLYLDMAGRTYGGVHRLMWQTMLLLGPWLARPPAVPETFIRAIDAALTFDIADRLDRITPPTLIIGGESDRLFPSALLSEDAARLPNASCLLIPGSGHGVFQEKKTAFDRAVLAFLAQPD